MRKITANSRNSWYIQLLNWRTIGIYTVLIGFQTASAQDTPSMSDTELATQIQIFVEDQVSTGQFSGALLVTHESRIVFQDAYGLASKAFNVPNQLDTKFNLGSMNKMITAVAVAQLVATGKINYDDAISQHLNDYPNEEAAGTVTIHHLLTHTSGLTDYFNDTFIETSRENYRTVKDFFLLFADKPLEFSPGSRWQYSNSNYIVLGAIIEAVSGETYFDYVREQIYEPLGMVNTDAYEMDYDTPNLAIGYTRSLKGDWKNNLFMHVIKGGPAGGGFSTVEDLTRFAQASLNHTLLSEQDTDFITTGKVPIPGVQDISYAYGFIEEKVNSYRRYGHSGGFPGINGTLSVYPELDYTVVVLANYDPPAADRVADYIGKLLTGD